MRSHVAAWLASSIVHIACESAFVLPCGDPPPEVIDTSSPTGRALEVELELEPDRSAYPATFAVWRIDSDGTAHTLFATCKVAHDEWDGGGERPYALPVWTELRDRALDATPALDVDAITGATPETRLTIVADVPPGAVEVRIEANASFDTNDAYPDDPNGQPSLVWRAQLGADASGPVDAIVIGHGSPDGSDADIATDVGGITTATGLLTRATVTRRP
jgi:hypothetical protein